MIMNLKTHSMLFDKNLCFNEVWLLITLSGPILLQTPMDNNVTLNIYGTVILVAEKKNKNCNIFKQELSFLPRGTFYTVL